MRNTISVICAIVKDEQRFIREWALHYLNIGFDKLYVYEDYGSESHQEQLSDLIHENKVKLTSLSQTGFIPHYKGTQVQGSLYLRFLRMCRSKEIRADWVGFFDVDEFLMFEEGWNLNRLVNDFDDTPGVLLAWKIYGANGHVKRPRGNIVDNYTTHLPLNSFYINLSPEWNVKSLVHVGQCTGYKHIHIFNGCECTNHSPLSATLVYEKAWLNHYYTKSWEDYKDRIFSRGNMLNNWRCLDDFFKCNPDMLKDKEKLVMSVRNRHCAGTMWISREMKIISGGNTERLNDLKCKYLI